METSAKRREGDSDACGGDGFARPGSRFDFHDDTVLDEGYAGIVCVDGAG